MYLTGKGVTFPVFCAKERVPNDNYWLRRAYYLQK